MAHDFILVEQDGERQFLAGNPDSQGSTEGQLDSPNSAEIYGSLQGVLERPALGPSLPDLAKRSALPPWGIAK